MRVLLADGSTITDDACQQRKVVGLPIQILAVEEDKEIWTNVLEENNQQVSPNEYKWVHTRVGPIRIKDRAAMSLKGAGFGVAEIDQKVKRWEKTDKGNLHKVVLRADGKWLHQAVPIAAVSDPNVVEKNMARGEGHKSLMRHMDMSVAFQFSPPAADGAATQ
jgi:hypothetical protein